MVPSYNPVATQISLEGSSPPSRFSEDFTYLSSGWMDVLKVTQYPNTAQDIFPILEHSDWVCTNLEAKKSKVDAGGQ